MLLLAPTQAAMARVACLPVRLPMFSCGREVVIVHASNDPFCPPSQVAALERTGAEVHLCDDMHALLDSASLEVIGASFARLLNNYVCEHSLHPAAQE